MEFGGSRHRERLDIANKKHLVGQAVPNTGAGSEIPCHIFFARLCFIFYTVIVAT
jgi:hypothetical protein